MGMPSGIELLVIAGVILLLFGGKKIPELAKGFGKGIKNFKSAVKEDDVVEATTTTKENIETKASETTTTASESKTNA